MLKVVNPFNRDMSNANTIAEACHCICHSGSARTKSNGKNASSCSCQCGSAAYNDSSNGSSAKRA